MNTTHTSPSLFRAVTLGTSPRLCRPGGFNLIEVVVALAVVSIGVISIVGLIPQAMESGRSALDRTIAATIVQDLFADRRNMDYDDLANAPAKTTLYFDAEGFLTDTSNLNNPPYFRVVVELADKRRPDGGTDTDVQVVTAIVSWRHPNPLNSDIFVTEIARYEP